MVDDKWHRKWDLRIAALYGIIAAIIFLISLIRGK
jgi:hypothetical protein